MCHFVFFRFFVAGGGLKAILTSGPLDKLIGMRLHIIYRPHNIIFNICIHINEAVAASSHHSPLSPYMRPSRRSVYIYTRRLYIYTYYYYYTYYYVLCDDPRRWPTALSRSVSWRGGAEVPDLDDNARGLCIYSPPVKPYIYSIIECTTAVYVGTYNVYIVSCGGAGNLLVIKKEEILINNANWKIVHFNKQRSHIHSLAHDDDDAAAEARGPVARCDDGVFVCACASAFSVYVHRQ